MAVRRGKSAFPSAGYMKVKNPHARKYPPIANMAHLRELIKDLTKIADEYDESDAGKRFALRTKAREISMVGTRGFDVPFGHLGNVSKSGVEGARLTSQMFELIAIRTLISVEAFKHIPLPGSISLQALSEKTGMQDSLLGNRSRAHW